ncbi:popeye domain-containing 2 [Lampris incognitus]|uniref:popeye domain-containing 2 n=1 Tax=Lampris incognitus TaxID=2546036 RepID=UPI0024B4B1C9|nr:popeye domain-containing 2 [Lampris incognitus]
MSVDNTTLTETIFYGHVPCDGWSNNTEGAIYHLGNTILVLGYMGGSGAYGCLFIFGFLFPSFLCLALWGWLTMCGLDVFTWNVLLLSASLAQICHLIYRLHEDGLPSEELTTLYQAVYLPLGVPICVFKEIAGAFENTVVELKAGETYAVEGKTPIDQLSFLLSGRINVSLEGQFLHYIHCHQFLDSPEWESLRPNEEGNFQVTLTAEEDSRYVSWRRQRLYILLSKERYIARLFSVMLGYDIAEKLYTLNNKLFIKSGVRLDIRLPSLYHVLAPTSQGSEGASSNYKDHATPGEGPNQQQGSAGEDPTSAGQHSAPPQPLQPHQQGPKKVAKADPQAPQPNHRPPWASDIEFPSGGDNNGSVPPRFQRGRAPLAPTDTPRL